MKDVSWYYHHNLKPQGPLAAAEMRARIYRGEVGPHELISNDREGQWKPACEWADFEASLFPAGQALVLGQEVSYTEKEWVLLVPVGDGKSFLQEGPFSVQDLSAMMAKKMVASHQYIWKSGLSGWCRIQDRPEFANSKHP